jgi:rhodanese-related sulfurtransferase
MREKMMNQIEFYEAKLKYETDSWDLSESIKNNQGVVVVDTRSAEAYEIEHIPLAINIPHRHMSIETTKDLAKSKIYVIYCDGIGCNASTKGAVKLTKLGFNVKELLGGLDWWKRDGYATEGKHSVDGKTIICGC